MLAQRSWLESKVSEGGTASARVAEQLAAARELPALTREDLAGSVVDVARDLVGCTIRHGETAGVIVETEAYHESEPACHAYIGRTARTVPLFGRPGIAYVYFSYGMHALLNVVCEREGVGAAVLIRALEPVDGIELMRERRGLVRDEDLCSGPGKLTQALGVGLELNGTDLFDGPIRLGPPSGERAGGPYPGGHAHRHHQGAGPAVALLRRRLAPRLASRGRRAPARRCAPPERASAGRVAWRQSGVCGCAAWLVARRRRVLGSPGASPGRAVAASARSPRWTSRLRPQSRQRAAACGAGGVVVVGAAVPPPAPAAAGSGRGRRAAGARASAWRGRRRRRAGGRRRRGGCDRSRRGERRRRDAERRQALLGPLLVDLGDALGLALVEDRLGRRRRSRARSRRGRCRPRPARRRSPWPSTWCRWGSRPRRRSSSGRVKPMNQASP